jgi:hypothetical protein
MSLSHDLYSSSFYIPRQVSADLCLHVVTLRVQVCSAASPAIPIVARIPPHDSNCAVSGILSVVFICKTPQYPVDSYRLTSMNSIGSAHADLFPRPRISVHVSTPDRILSLSESIHSTASTLDRGDARFSVGPDGTWIFGEEIWLSVSIHERLVRHPFELISRGDVL